MSPLPPSAPRKKSPIRLPNTTKKTTSDRVAIRKFNSLCDAMIDFQKRWGKDLVLEVKDHWARRVWPFILDDYFSDDAINLIRGYKRAEALKDIKHIMEERRSVKKWERARCNYMKAEKDWEEEKEEKEEQCPPESSRSCKDLIQLFEQLNKSA